MSIAHLLEKQKQKKATASLEDASNPEEKKDDLEGNEDLEGGEGGEENTDDNDDGEGDDDSTSDDDDNSDDDLDSGDNLDDDDSNDDDDNSDDDLEGDEPTEDEGPVNEDLDESEVEQEIVYESAELDQVSEDIADQNHELEAIEEEDESAASLESAISLMSSYAGITSMAKDSPTAGISVETALCMQASLESVMGKQTTGQVFVGAESFAGNSKRSNLTNAAGENFEISVESANLTAWDQVKNIFDMITNWFQVEGKHAAKLKVHADALSKGEVTGTHPIAMGKGNFNTLAIGGNMGNLVKNLDALIKVAKEITSEKSDIKYLSSLIGVDFKAGNDEEFEASRAKLLDVMTSEFPKWSFLTKNAPEDDRAKEAKAAGLELKASPALMGDYQIISLRDATGAKTIEGSRLQGFLWHDIRTNQVRGKQKIDSLGTKDIQAVAGKVSELLELLIQSKTSEDLAKLRQEVKGAVASYKKLTDKELAKGNSAEFRELNRAIRGNVRALSVIRTSFVAHAFSVACAALEYCDDSVKADAKAAKKD